MDIEKKLLAMEKRILKLEKALSIEKEKNEIAVVQEKPKDITTQFFKDVVDNTGMYTQFIDYLVDKWSDREHSSAELIKFYSYWTESNQSWTKQRWQMEKTFDVKRRLATWFSRSSSFSKPVKQIENKRSKFTC